MANAGEHRNARAATQRIVSNVKTCTPKHYYVTRVAILARLQA